MVDDWISRLESEYDEATGFIGKLRFGTFDEIGFERMIRLLREIQPEDRLARRLVTLLWWLPWIVEWQCQRVPDDLQLRRTYDAIFGQVERILGVA